MKEKVRVDWDAVRGEWRDGLIDLGRKEKSLAAARKKKLLPKGYEDDAVTEKWWRDIIGNLFKQPTGDGTTVAICVQPGVWEGSDECGWDAHNLDWNRIADHREAVAQKLAQKAAYMEARFHRGPERLPEPERKPDLDYDDERGEE